MKQKKIKVIYIVAVAVPAIIGLPIFLNWLLIKNTPQSFKVVGEGKDWLTFYGSYIGGIIAASISFIILLITIIHNKKNSEINRQEENLRRLEDDLKNRVAQLDFSKITNVMLVLNDYDRFKEEILKLDTFYQELMYSSNSFKLIYGDEIDGKITNFKSSYTLCISDLLQYINEMKVFISKLPPYISNEKALILKRTVFDYNSNSIWTDKSNSKIIEIEGYREQIESISQRESIIKEMGQLSKNINNYTLIDAVYTAAKLWIKAEREKLATLKK